MISFMRDITDEIQKRTMRENFGITTNAAKMKSRNAGLNSWLAEISVVGQELLIPAWHLSF